MKKPIPNNNEKSLDRNDFIVSKTDLKRRIIYCNKIFIELAGYDEKELLGAPHNIVRHPDMPKVVFKLLWDRLKKKQEIFAYVKNLSKDGGYYWVFANVTATLDEKGNVRDYHSVRRKPSDKAMKVIPSLYKELLDAEKRGGVEASYKKLNEILNKKGLSYDQFVLGLQQ